MTKNVWIKAFWGFDPSNWGYIGFTRESDRDRLMRELSEDDLILIYGADSAETEQEKRRQALGFLQIVPTPIMDYERQSEQGREWKAARGLQDRWTFALPVKRAWQVQRKIEIKHLAPQTYNHNYARIIASQGKMLTPQEAENVLQLPVLPVNVYGEPPVAENALTETTMGDTFEPSRGLVPSFGIRTSEYQDGEHYLYMLKFDGNIAAILDHAPSLLHGKSLVKVGLSKDPIARCEQLNAGFPPAGSSRWKPCLKSKAFKNGIDAKNAEDFIKQTFANEFESLGGEFFLGNNSDMESLFARASAPTAFTIKV